jgi:hypothetical protein
MQRSRSCDRLGSYHRGGGRACAVRAIPAQLAIDMDAALHWLDGIGDLEDPARGLVSAST